MEVTLVVKESFSIPQRGFLVALQHHLTGLPPQTILYSPMTDRKWEVVSRVMLTHMIDEQVCFTGEQVNPIQVSFSSLDRLAESSLALLERERNHIFEYHLKGIDHLEKPTIGEYLYLDNTQNLY